MGQDIVAAGSAQVLFRDSLGWGLVVKRENRFLVRVGDEGILGCMDVQLAGDAEGDGAGVERVVLFWVGGFEQEEPVGGHSGGMGQDVGIEESDGLG